MILIFLVHIRPSGSRTFFLAVRDVDLAGSGIEHLPLVILIKIAQILQELPVGIIDFASVHPDSGFFLAVADIARAPGTGSVIAGGRFYRDRKAGGLGPFGQGTFDERGGADNIGMFKKCCGLQQVIFAFGGRKRRKINRCNIRRRGRTATT